MSTQLDRILTHTALEVRDRRAIADVALLERRAAEHNPRGFEAALRKTAANGPAIIAELKKASPSRGLIRPDFDPVALALSLEAAGAAALSILTDREFFQGSLENLTLASASVRIPCLRKDFIVDPFQILEARAAGADAVLLIVAALSDVDLETLYAEAMRIELDVLCEIHDLRELDRAVALGFSVIGVNSRNLHTMQVDPQTQIELAQRLPSNVLRVAESGIRHASDIARMAEAGYDAFLVGESLMRQPDPAAALAALLDRKYSRRDEIHAMWVKICGNTNLEDAASAAELGADAVGFVFAESKRQVTPAQVAEITPHLPPGVERVGVFYSHDAEEIFETAIRGGLTAVQLHGGLDDRLAGQLANKFGGEVRIIQTLHWVVNSPNQLSQPDVSSASQLERQILHIAASGIVDRVLIDSKVGAAGGGTGVPFDWTAAREIFASAPSGLHLIVAGGLNPDNVARAIAHLVPWGADVSSGVEASPGRKDPARMERFIANARGTQTP